jgi:hypothetical protein
MQSAFDRWLTNDSGFRGAWVEVSETDMRNDDGPTHFEELSCDLCKKFIGWHEGGFEPFFSNEADDALCLPCHHETTKEIGE